MYNPLSVDSSSTQCASISATRYSGAILDQMNCLYLLSYLVTADRDLAEQCLARALDEYVDGRSEFLIWSDTEGRRAVLREAIHAIRPVLQPAYWLTYRDWAPPEAKAYQPFAAITSLTSFERFAFVMCTIESLSEEESARLLNCSIQDVVIGHELARKIVAMQDGEVTGEMALFVVPAWLGDQVCGVC